MIYATVCSGIEAPSVAWQSLGWQFAFTSEIEHFPCSVLKHHYPKVPNYGDMLQHKDWPASRIDLLCAGTPCQAFSVAGLRKGLADPRGNLTLAFLGVVEQFAPAWVVWENVPGVLSIDGGRTFAAFLGGLGQLGYGFAYCVLDAQYFGLAQRRKRVFVVGHSGGQWQRAAAVLFDRESLCGHPAPRREARERIAPTVEVRAGRSGETNFHTSGGLVDVAPTISARTRGGRGLGTDAECDGAVIPIQEIGKRQSGTPMNGVGYGSDGDPMFTLQSNVQHGIAATLRACSSTKAGHAARAGDKDENLVVHSLKADGFDASEDGTGRGVPLVPEVAYAFQERDSKGSDSKGSDSNTKDGHLLPVAFTQNQSGDVLTGDVSAAVSTNQNATGRNTAKVQTGMAVRRLTVVECSRLQGFPDRYLLDVIHRGKPATDGPCYKALGNSMAVPVLRWIGERISLVSKLSQK